MSNIVFSDRITPRYIGYAFLLPGSFISGFLVGAFLASGNRVNCISLIRCTAQAPTNVVGLFLQIALTFSLTALICLSRRKWLILLQCFVHSLIFGISTTSVFFAYGSAQWLISSLLLFTSTITLISALCLWSRILIARGDSIRRDFLVPLMTSIAAAIIDSSFVSTIFVSCFILARKVRIYVGFGSCL